MSEFHFTTDEASATYVREVVDQLVVLFGITKAEALGRVNKHWRGQAIVGESFIYHESPDYFAKLIYYPPGVPWWKGETGLKGRPFP